ncbi:MAG: prepilin-type N-terminal cleavage/methylation domain-containing protein [Synergistaceae bacterium]|nr:prepilin-type N-terminal cleavage/methylation domain-containing protein [Synergistaceae bacterium]
MINARRRGMSLVEVLIAVLIFTFGIGTISAAMIYGLRTILASKEAVVSDQQVLNAGETYMMKHIMEGKKIDELSPSDLGLPENAVKSQVRGGTTYLMDSSENRLFSIPFNIYRLKTSDKSNPIYIFERQ